MNGFNGNVRFIFLMILQDLQDLRLKHRKIPLIGYLNINSLRNKISDLRVLLHDLHTA